MDFQQKRLEKLQSIRKALASVETKADESMHTDNTGAGEEFVDTGMASTVLNKVREENTLLSKLPTSIIMPTADYKLPIEGGDPTWYATAENKNVPADHYDESKAGTDSITLSAKKYTTMVYASGELDEDSIVNIRTYLGNKLATSYGELLDKAILNGDTETGATGNVNSDDGAPTAGSYFLHQDGLRKHALTNSLDTSIGALDVADLRQARYSMGKRGQDPSKLILACDLGTYYKILGLSQVETIEKFGQSATIVDGVLRFVDGMEVHPTSFLGTTEADGKISTTPANNTLGQALLIYKDDIITGFKRNLSLYTQFLPETDQFRWTAHTRFALKVRDEKSVAMLRNITIS